MSIEARSVTAQPAPPRDHRHTRCTTAGRAPVNDWIYRVFQLADRLTNSGDLRTSAWRQAFCGVPRHELVPRFFTANGDGTYRLVDCDDPTELGGWLDAIYSDQTLVTTVTDVLTGVGAVQISTSSSTMPSLMMRMLEDLDVTDGDRVLEIGTATGYNAALLCARLGEENVFSVDLQPDLVDAARDRLGRLGHHPTLLAQNGRDGLAEHGPYDRILSTCSVRQIPIAWIEQTRPGGMILTDVQGSLSAGNIVKLYRGNREVVQGRFLTRDGGRYGNFMPLHRDLEVSAAPSPRADRAGASERRTLVAPGVLYDWRLPVGFLAQLHLPPTITLSRVGGCVGTRTRLTATDGSWCEVVDRPDRHGEYQVVEAGPQSLWYAVEHAYRLYEGFDEPSWDRFGITATPERQHVWIDHPEYELTPLPAG